MSGIKRIALAETQEGSKKGDAMKSFEANYKKCGEGKSSNYKKGKK